MRNNSLLPHFHLRVQARSTTPAEEHVALRMAATPERLSTQAARCSPERLSNALRKAHSVEKELLELEATTSDTLSLISNLLKDRVKPSTAPKPETKQEEELQSTAEQPQASVPRQRSIDHVLKDRRNNICMRMGRSSLDAVASDFSATAEDIHGYLASPIVGVTSTLANAQHVGGFSRQAGIVRTRSIQSRRQSGRTVEAQGEMKARRPPIPRASSRRASLDCIRPMDRSIYDPQSIADTLGMTPHHHSSAAKPERSMHHEVDTKPNRRSLNEICLGQEHTTVANRHSSDTPDLVEHATSVLFKPSPGVATASMLAQRLASMRLKDKQHNIILDALEIPTSLQLPPLRGHESMADRIDPSCRGL
mmetsp:Transcript_16221/g.48253  ORF Transcript_16221/g.48253 Transcript_16221/m.48253 type:complete len:365 (+) Transcript_16221:4036-5130(+)